MTASGGAEGVGRAVNQAVVIAFIGIGAVDYVFTQTLLATQPGAPTGRDEPSFAQPRAAASSAFGELARFFGRSSAGSSAGAC